MTPVSTMSASENKSFELFNIGIGTMSQHKLQNSVIASA